ncbi:MAG: peptidase M16 [Bacteroidetes bacterium]|nr:peptidase M16 [Bacteroidota bacterium]
MEDLLNATVEDVKEFHQKFYGPNNATLVLAGDFDVDEAKILIQKYFGEIKKGNDIVDPLPMPVTLTETKKVYHEDNFARASQLRMIWPTVEQYNDDSFPLDYLGEVLSSGKKAPFYKILEKEKQLTSSQYAYNSSQEIAGTFNVVVTSNQGVSLKEVEENIFDGFALFEKEGITDEDVERIKASLETNFYNGITSILGKSYQLANYNEYTGDPAYFSTYIEKLKAVTKEDIMRVYDKYVKGKPYLATSFVPKGKLDMIAEGSIMAEIVEEDITNAAEVGTGEDEVEEEIVITPTTLDRSIMPEDGPDPLLNLPIVWTEELDNNMGVYGIEHNELPLVRFNIVLRGGHYLDQLEKAGVANLVAQLMMEGTENKTPLELEEEIEKLGARISIYASNNEISIDVNTLARNYDKALALVEEILLEPRWDEEEFDLAKTEITNRLLRQKADPNTLARQTFNGLVYGNEHIFSIDSRGTPETVATITIDDLKDYYNANFSPSVASFHVSGNIDKAKVMSSLIDLEAKWQAKEVVFPEYELPESPQESKIYFVDVPGAKQSVINIGGLGLSRTDNEFYPVTVMNYKLGGSFNGYVNLVLREEKGFTYGARTNFSGSHIPGVFKASSGVRSNATQESVAIFKDLMEQYREGITDEDLAFTKNALIKSNALKFETLRALIGMLEGISMYDLPDDYVIDQEEIVRNMTMESHKELAQKYIDPAKMYYVIVGDAATQLEPLEEIGFGKPEVIIP